ncbi:MAG: DUF4837 family protein [Bacteroidaceae bacterium]|nr:DUF4837 family protein [Bacteroidaceae bacterium]
MSKSQEANVTAPLPHRANASRALAFGEPATEGRLGESLLRVGLLGLGLLFLLVACTDREPRQLSESKGQPAELLVVVPSGMQHGELADTLREIIDCDAPGLGSSERIFRSMTIGERGYQKIYRVMHSQLRVELDPSLKEPTLGVAHDVHARPQLQLLVRGASQQQLCRFLSQNRERIQRIILDFQLDRYAGILRHKSSQKVTDDLKKLGYDVRMPVDMVATKSGRDFLWGSSNRGGDKDIHFVFYTYPWQGEDVADTALFVQKRDSVLKVNIPGSQPGQWMTTARDDYGRPVLWPVLRRRDGRLIYEVRGLWEMHGGFMGGPLVANVQVDTAARRVVVAEGFVFSPNSAKRDLLRSVEAGLRTLKKISAK